MQDKLIVVGCLLIAGLLVWVYRLKKRQHYLDYISSCYEHEKEAVISLLNRIGERVTESIDLVGALEIIADFIVDSTNAEAGAIFLVDRNGTELSAKVVLGLFPPLHETTGYVLTKRKYLVEKVKKDKIRLGEGIVGAVAEKGEPLLIEDAVSDPRVPKSSGDFLAMKSLMLAPLRVRDKIVGVFVVVNKKNDQHFTTRDMQLLQALADQAAVTVDIVSLYEELKEKHRMEQELSLAKEFQNLLLPKKCPELPGLDVGAFNTPALEVGGDYYDFITVDENHLGIVIADVSGKGIPGALVMAMVRSTLRAEAIGKLSPKEVLRRVNDRVFKDTKENVFITMTYGILDLRTHRMKMARAGHEPTITLRSGDPTPALIVPDGIALGLVGGDLFDIMQETEIDLSDGDMVVLYTDGVIEAMNDQSQEYGRERLLELVQKESELVTAEIIEKVVRDIEHFTQGIPQHDDITMVAIKARDLASSEKDARAALEKAG